MLLGLDIVIDVYVCTDPAQHLVTANTGSAIVDDLDDLDDLYDLHDLCDLDHDLYEVRKTYRSLRLQRVPSPPPPPVHLSTVPTRLSASVPLYPEM